MKDLFLKFCNWALAAMGVASVTSCESGWLNGLKCEYGTPYCSFEVKCRVVDSMTGIPVKGVKLTPGYKYQYKNEQGEIVEGFQKIQEDGTLVDDGECELSGIKYISGSAMEDLHLKLTDIDPDADGHYKDTIYLVKMEKIKDSGPEETWNVGTYAADVTLKAEEVEAKE
ncbi:MAG: radical SAM-associated putative lipoprotein [Candidatus Cryptobacteroides sp.]